MKNTKDVINHQLQKIKDTSIHAKVLQNMEPYQLFNALVGTTFDEDGFENAIKNIPEILGEGLPNDVPDYSDILIAKYNFINLQNPCFICNSPLLEYIESIEINGIYQEDIHNVYTFETNGIHTIKFKLNTDTITNSYFSGNSNLVSIIIPEIITDIQSGAFGGCSSLSYISLGGKMKFLRSSLFPSSFLKELIIPDNIETLPSNFLASTNIENLVIGDGIKEIPSQCFANSQIENIDFGNSVESLGSNIFNFCNNLKSVFLPDNIKYLSPNTFAGAQNLESIVIGKDIEEIPIGCFSGDTKLANIENGKNVKIINSNALYGSKITSLPFENLIKLGDGCFGGCSLLESIITNNIEEIGNGTFSGCISFANSIKLSKIKKLGQSALPPTLEYIKIGNNLESLSTSTFMSSSLSSKLKSIQIGDIDFEGTPQLIIPTACFNNFNKLTNAILGNCIESIMDNVFSGCTNLETIKLPDSISKISDNTFKGCSKLNNIIINDNITEIGNSAFYNCSRLSNITLGKNIEKIGHSAFESCNNLTSITLPNSLKELGSRVFYGTNLSSILLPEGLEKIGAYAFDGILSTIDSIKIPNSVTNITGLFSGNNTNIRNIEFGTGISSIPNSFMPGNSNLKSLIINKIDSIGSQAFSNCTYLTNVTIDAEEIGENAFRSCAISSILFGSNVKSIGSNAFFAGYNLETLNIPDNITSLGDNSFNGNGSRIINHINIGSGITTIPSRCFYGIKNLVDVTISGNNLTSIANNAFDLCNSLSSINLPESLITIGNNAFSSCSLTNIVIPDNVTTIGNNAFMSNRIETLTIGSSVETIGNTAFPRNINTTPKPDYIITVKAITPPTVGTKIFGNLPGENDTHEMKIYVPAESVETYKAAENWSDYADIIEAIIS